MRQNIVFVIKREPDYKNLIQNTVLNALNESTLNYLKLYSVHVTRII